VGLPSQRDCSMWQFNDGGRAAAGYRGSTRDCVCRAISIATEIPYTEVYALIESTSKCERPRGGKMGSNPRNGVHIPTIRKLMNALGWVWTPTMAIGQGCKVHLKAEELPKGRLVVSVSKHLCAVVDGVIHDNHDPSREGTRCVYGYWQRCN
jgi:hypothetical protein